MCETMTAYKGGFRGLLGFFLVQLCHFAVSRVMTGSFGVRRGCKVFCGLLNLMEESLFWFWEADPNAVCCYLVLTIWSGSSYIHIHLVRVLLGFNCCFLV